MMYYTAIIIIVWFALLVLSIIVFENNRISKQTKIIMYLTYLVTAIAALAEWLGVQFNGNANIPAWLLKLIKLFDYILTPIAGGAIVLQLHTKSIWQKIIFGILGVNILFQIISFFTGWMVVIGDDHKYVHGPAYVAYAVIYSLIIIFVIVEFAVYGARFKKQNRISLYALLLFVGTGIVLQEVFGSEIRTAYISIAVGLSLMFIHYSEFSQLETDMRLREQIKLVSLDALTGISNRHAYIEALQEMNKMDYMPDDLVIFSIDINGLKKVNDTLGHNAGDELICAAADCITNVFDKYGKCYRTGGDEFIVIANMDKANIIPVSKQLNKVGAAWKGKATKGVSFSIGSATRVDNPKLQFEKLVILADQRMYKEKDNYYRSTGLERREY